MIIKIIDQNTLDIIVDADNYKDALYQLVGEINYGNNIFDVLEIEEAKDNYINPACYECEEELKHRMYESTFNSHELVEHLTCVNKECSFYMDIQD